MSTYYLLDLRRMLRNRANMFFVVGLPAFMFLIFGALSGFGDETAGNGNAAMYVMISMAAYGAVTATTSVSGGAALEQIYGWGRQLGLTRLRPANFITVKTLLAMTVATAPIVFIYLIGAATGSRGSAGAWLLSALIVWAGSAIFAIYGLAMSLVFRAESAVSVASGLIVVMAFLGNVFSPLSGVLLEIGRFTPLYGYAALARYPLTEGYLATGEQDPLWWGIANVSAWTLLFVALAAYGVRRGRARQ